MDVDHAYDLGSLHGVLMERGLEVHPHSNDDGNIVAEFGITDPASKRHWHLRLLPHEHHHHDPHPELS